jgi:LPS-assembly protein
MVVVGATARAQEPSAPPACPTAFARVVLTQGVELCAEAIRETGRGSYAASGGVTIHLRSANSRLQADSVEVTGARTLQAVGNVLIVWDQNRISGSRMTYDLETKNGVIEDAFGEAEPEFFFTAARVEKIGEDRLHLEDATITTCTQPVPYWSFSVSSADVRLDNYAHMWNLRLRVKHAPVVYLPYLLWPVKRDRSAGLLFPNFGSTRNRGRTVSQSLFLPIGRSADLTLFGEYYTRAGWGGGGRLRLVPNRDGDVEMTGFYIQDQVFGAGRWTLTYKQTQKFLNGFRMIADVNQVSDFNFYTDYERDLSLVSSPTILARLEFSRNGSWTSLNVRERRREQLFADGTSLIQQTLPEIEWRGRSKRLGRTPLYATYEASLANVQQRSSRIDADYLRGDFFPTLSAPVSPRPWLDITPSINLRATHYTQTQAPQTDASAPVEVRGQDLTRVVAGAGIEVVGPKFFRIFERPRDSFSARYKHTFEPRVSYRWQDAYDRNEEILVYDEVDRSIGTADLVTYGLRSRLIARRPRAAPPAPEGEGERVLVTEGDTGRVREAPPAGAAAAETDATGPAAPREPVEIAAFEISQTRSFGAALGRADLDRDGINESVSQRSDILASARLNPGRNLSLDLRSSYNVLYDRLSDVSLSGNWRSEDFRTRFSLVRRAGLTVGSSNSTQIRLAAGATVWDGRLRFDVDGSYNPNARGLEVRIPDQRWRVEYYLQCCGLLAEYFKYDFAENQRRDFRFTVDLRGIGKLFDFRGATQN